MGNSAYWNTVDWSHSRVVVLMIPIDAHPSSGGGIV
jgi:hypothetical protein